MVLFLKPKSCTRVTDEKRCLEDCKEYIYKADNDKSGGASSTTCTFLTVWRKSLLMSCSGFTVIDCTGNLIYRVDNYRGRPGEIVLMDASGTSIFTTRRHKTIRLVDDWLVYKGDASDHHNTKTFQKKQPICYVRKNVSLLLANSNVLAHVFLGATTNNPIYVIEGSYAQRSCKMIDKSSKKVVAEIKRKEAANGHASFGLEVFHLVVYPGFNPGFAMTLVLLLDQMFS
ncbi:protein LURP-one-related 17-like [Chenopodium quinoa]|uniref:protein LURP-one-related 17-like n=1 Tax=Chenopodium quinoa TaxID=63459 RepID=UPI000B794F9D|nr:protein LURP-one-related 17-like [Chenopodium quinoa]